MNAGPKCNSSAPGHPADGLRVFLGELAIRQDVPPKVRLRAHLLAQVHFTPTARWRLASETAAHLDAARHAIGVSFWRGARDCAAWSGVPAWRVLLAYCAVKSAAAIVGRRSS